MYTRHFLMYTRFFYIYLQNWESEKEKNFKVLHFLQIPQKNHLYFSEIDGGHTGEIHFINFRRSFSEVWGRVSRSRERTRAF